MQQDDLARLWKLQPDFFAAVASQGRWQPYRWLQYLSDRITPAILKGNARFLICAAPQHGKSEFISNWLPTWFLHNFPRRRVILTSYASSYAEKWGSKVKENLTLNPYAAIPMRTDTKSKKVFMTAEGGGMMSVGIGGPITGSSAELLLVDDPTKNYQEAMSPLIRERNLDWFRSVARTRLQPGASVIVMHTRWHEADLIGELSREPGWELISIPALCDDEAIDVLHRKLGEAMCPERYNESALQSLKTDLGPMIWEALFQQNPVPVGGNIIRGDWIRFYDILPVLDETAIFADLTYEKGKQNDYTVVECWGRRGPDVFLISQIRAQMGFGEQLDAIGRMIEAHPGAFHKEIEKKANGAAVIETVCKRFPGVVANNPQTSKEARLAAVSPIFRSGNVYFPNPERNPWVKTNIHELTRFPAAEHDDCCDVASMAVGYLARLSSTIARLSALAKW